MTDEEGHQVEQKRSLGLWPVQLIILYCNTVKPVLRGHDLWDKEKVVF